MQFPPLTFTDVTLLIALGAVILLITAELYSPYHGLTKSIISKRKLRNAALFLSVLFLITTAIRIVGFLFNQ